MDPAGRAAGIERTIAGPLPLSALSASWPLRFRQPRPLLLPQLPRPHKSSTGADVHWFGGLLHSEPRIRSPPLGLGPLGSLNQVTKGLAKTIRAMADGTLDSQVGARICNGLGIMRAWRRGRRSRHTHGMRAGMALWPTERIVS